MDMKLDGASGQTENPLGKANVGRLIFKFSIPAIVSFLMNAMYNIVDQIFIGQGVGLMGNAATNVAFPLTTLCTSLALLLGVGSASNFNLRLGAGDKETAGHVAGNGIAFLGMFGILVAVAAQIFLEPLMYAFGATEDVLPYAMTYTRITALGIPFFMFTAGVTFLIRSDGSPVYSMICTLAGAILNTILDPIFIFVFDLGIAGAAWATVIGQVLSFILTIPYLARFKTMPLTTRLLRPKFSFLRAIASLGAAASINQIAMAVVQIAMNNTLRYYGALSPYGSDIPLGCAGVIAKVSVLLMAFVLGIAQGCQPIVGFNYGAKNYSRVKKTYRIAAVAVLTIGIVAGVCFQLFPRQIVGIFGQGSELYFHFAERYFRIYMALVFLIGFQPLTSNFFTSIGKAKKGIILSVTRQIVFLLPLILIFSACFGIDGVMYAGPISDGAAFLLAMFLVRREMRAMSRLEQGIP